jgi:signal transduction histidine kinase
MTTQRKLTIYQEFGTFLAQKRGLDALMVMMATISQEIVDADRATIYFYDEEKSLLWSKVGQGLDTRIEVGLNQGVAGITAAMQETQIVLDAKNDIRFNPEVDTLTGYVTRSILAIPLVGMNEKLLGVIQVINKHNNEYFNVDDANELLFLGEYAALIIENAMWNLKLQDEVDEKTKELQEINEHLEQRIQEELEKNIHKERLLAQQSRHAAMGEMIANIAHQWRQPIASIDMAINNLQLNHEMDTLSLDKATLVYDDIHRYTSFLVNTISDFSNFFAANKKAINFNLYEYINNAIKLLDAHLKTKKIDITVNADDLTLSSDGFPNEFAQVILNLVKNAADAYDNIEVDKKQIVISLSTIEISKILYNQVTIQDYAGGIPSTIMDKIFDSHFTTKESSEGTGIGLNMSKQIIECNMDGKLGVMNNDEGALFIIRLPKFSLH